MADPTVPRTQVQEALGGLLPDGEVIVGWHVTIDVLTADGGRYLAHRAGGGIDGTDPPTLWTVVGMLRGATVAADGQLTAGTEDA